ncbi:unnamed protein product, partial [Aureobasidium pullulans]
HVGEGDESTGLGANDRVFAEHDSGLESVGAISVGVADVLLESLTVAEVGVEAGRTLRIPSQSAVAVLVTGDVGGFWRQQRQLAEHDSGLESVEAIVVGVALVVLDNLAVAEVGVEAALGHVTADVDAVMFVLDGLAVAEVGVNHESGDGENLRDSQQVHKRVESFMLDDGCVVVIVIAVDV